MELLRVPRLHLTEHGVHVTVRDNGPGMAPALLARATEPFFTTRPDGGGTGLGLYVCEAIVKARDSVADDDAEFAANPNELTEFVSRQISRGEARK